MSGFCLKCDVPRPCQCFDETQHENALLKNVFAFLNANGLHASDQVVPGLYLGDLRAAVKDRDAFTHIVSLLDDENLISCVDSTLLVRMSDSSEQDLMAPLDAVCNFLHSILATGDDSFKVLIHCLEGRSRSSAIMMGVLMREKQMTFEDAYNSVIKARPRINPQDAFLNQLREQCK